MQLDTYNMSSILDITIMSLINNGLSELREERGWTQGRLAVEAGVSRQSINSIERGRYTPGLELALKLGQIFECPVDEIFWLEAT
jgi:putative transcriptional regulator